MERASPSWCRSLQVWGWTVHGCSNRDCSPRCRSLQVWGWTVQDRLIHMADQVSEPPSVGVDSSLCIRRMWDERVPEPPSVGVDSSEYTSGARPSRCRSLQVWGWTVHIHRCTNVLRGCRSLQVWGWTVPRFGCGAFGDGCRSLQVWGWTVHVWVVASTGGIDGGCEEGVPEPPSVWGDSSLTDLGARTN